MTTTQIPDLPGNRHGLRCCDRQWYPSSVPRARRGPTSRSAARRSRPWARGWPRRRRDGTEIIDATGRHGHPGRRRRARPSRASLLRHGLERRLEHGHPRGGARRRDHRDRLRHPVRRGEPRSTPTTTGWPGPNPRRASITASTSPSPTGIATAPRWRKWSAMGCPTFKEFMIYASEGWQADDRAIYNTLERCRDLGGDAAGARRVEPRARRADRAASHARADAAATAHGCTP